MKDVKYLDTTQAAAYLGLSRRTLNRYRVSGDGPMYLRFGNRVRYVREDLDEWARSDGDGDERWYADSGCESRDEQNSGCAAEFDAVDRGQCGG